MPPIDVSGVDRRGVSALACASPDWVEALAEMDGGGGRGRPPPELALGFTPD